MNAGTYLPIYPRKFVYSSAFVGNLICIFIPQRAFALDVHRGIIRAYDNMRFPVCRLTFKRGNDLCGLRSEKGFHAFQLQINISPHRHPFLLFA